MMIRSKPYINTMPPIICNKHKREDCEECGNVPPWKYCSAPVYFSREDLKALGKTNEDIENIIKTAKKSDT